MKAFRFIAIAMTALIAQSSYAQGWQIDGGFANRKQAEASQYDQGYYDVDSEYSQNFEAPISFVIGYVNKTWHTECHPEDGIPVNENFWGDRNKRLHGFQIGALYEPTVDLGLVKFGVSTGLNLEFYLSECNTVRKAGYDRFTELSTHIPLHAKFTLPVSDDISLSVYGGLGMNLAIIGTFEEDYNYRDYYGDRVTDTYYEYQDYGDGFPKRLNFQTELGGSINVNHWGFKFVYSQGLTDHHLYQGTKTFQNKINASITYSF